MLWFNLDHRHILKFKGITENVVGISGPCMILQWAENKDLSRYLDGLVLGGLNGPKYVRKIDKWVGEPVDS